MVQRCVIMIAEVNQYTHTEDRKMNAQERKAAQQQAKAIFRKFMIFPDQIRIVNGRIIALVAASGNFGKPEYDEVAHITGNRLYADRVYNLDGSIVS